MLLKSISKLDDESVKIDEGDLRWLLVCARGMIEKDIVETKGDPTNALFCEYHADILEAEYLLDTLFD